jgi:hypothetical protein
MYKKDSKNICQKKQWSKEVCVVPNSMVGLSIVRHFSLMSVEDHLPYT